jgi:hypothetical protein
MDSQSPGISSQTYIRQLNYPAEYANPIFKIIWSSFDYTSGPLLNLALKYSYGTSTSEHNSYHESITSSSSPLDNGSEQGQFEDIDDVFSSQLITVHEASETHLTDKDGSSSCTSCSEAAERSSDETLLKEMEESAVDSGIATNYSVHSELSQALSNSIHLFPDELTPSFSEMQAELSKLIDEDAPHFPSPPRATSVNSSKSSPMPIDSQNELLSSISGELGLPSISDEEYVSKHALAEQISGNFLPCDPVVHKLTVIPSRNLAFGSHIFWLNPSTKDSSMMAFSVLFNDTDESWYSEHQHFFDDFMEDLTQLFKAKYFSGYTNDEIASFLTQKFEQLISIVASVRTWPNSPRDLKLEDNLLYHCTKDNQQFLYKSIAGCIMSQGHTYIYGGQDFMEIRKMVITLSLFLNEKSRKLCTTPCATQVNEYLCLQVVNEKEVLEMRENIVSCRWPACIIDMNRKKVMFSGPYWKHRQQRENYQKQKICAIMRRSKKLVKRDLNLVNIHTLPSHYIKFLSILPSSNNGFGDILNHFHVMMRNEAKAFIDLIQNLSQPTSEAKSNPYSCKFKLIDVMNHLRITSMEGLYIVLANAENLLPSISDFITENAHLPN